MPRFGAFPFNSATRRNCFSVKGVAVLSSATRRAASFAEAIISARVISTISSMRRVQSTTLIAGRQLPVQPISDAVVPVRKLFLDFIPTLHHEVTYLFVLFQRLFWQRLVETLHSYFLWTSFFYYT